MSRQSKRSDMSFLVIAEVMSWPEAFVNSVMCVCSLLGLWVLMGCPWPKSDGRD